MTESSMTSLRLALTHNGAAIQYLECILPDCTPDEEKLLKKCLSKLKHFRQEVFRRQHGPDKERFIKDVVEADYLQIDHILTSLLHLEDNEKDVVEEMITKLAKG